MLVECNPAHLSKRGYLSEALLHEQAIVFYPRGLAGSTSRFLVTSLPIKVPKLAGNGL